MLLMQQRDLSLSTKSSELKFSLVKLCSTDLTKRLKRITSASWQYEGERRAYVHIVSPATPVVITATNHRACQALCVLLAVVSLTATVPATAQLSAKLTEKKNVVKYSRND